MEVRQVQNLDPFPGSFRCFRMPRLGLGKQARQIERRLSWRWAELAVKVVADVLSVQASHIRKCQHLGPDGSETSCGIVVNASCIRAELESFAELDQKTWDTLRRILCDGFSNTQCSFTLCAVARRGIVIDYVRDIYERCLQQGCGGRVGNVGQWLRVVDRVIISRWYSVWVCKIERECDIEDGIVESWLRLLSLDGRFPIGGEGRGWETS